MKFWERGHPCLLRRFPKAFTSGLDYSLDETIAKFRSLLAGSLLALSPLTPANELDNSLRCSLRGRPSVRAEQFSYAPQVLPHTGKTRRIG